jgi:KilA-N domain
MNKHNSSIVKHFNGKKIRINPTSKLVCLTDICKASGKKLNNFLRQQNIPEFVSELSALTLISVNELLIVGGGNRPTWGHPQLAIKCAAWCSSKFEVLMTSWALELLTTGKVQLNPTPTLPIIIDQNDVERGIQFGKAVAMRAFEGEKLDVPEGWLTIREHLIEIVGDSDTVKQSGASYWICRSIADLYRANTSENPPQVSTKRGGTFCYPTEYLDAIEAEWNSYTKTHSEQMEQIVRDRENAPKQCSLFDLFPQLEAA